MIEIQNEDLFGKVIADSVKRVDANRYINTFEKVRAVNAIAKAAVRINTGGAFMEFCPEDGNLIIWSASNEIYEIKPDNRCQCKASMNGYICWHKCAKRLLEHYFEELAALPAPTPFSADKAIGAYNEMALHLNNEARNEVTK